MKTHHSERRFVCFIARVIQTNSSKEATLIATMESRFPQCLEATGIQIPVQEFIFRHCDELTAYLHGQAIADREYTTLQAQDAATQHAKETLTVAPCQIGADLH